MSNLNPVYDSSGRGIIAVDGWDNGKPVRFVPEYQLRQQIAKDIEALMEESSVNTAVFALLWIKKCADRARG
jgi:hypothetical protein